jgi:hypothetical protein
MMIVMGRGSEARMDLNIALEFPSSTLFKIGV